MITQIGIVAGEIWHHLDQHGEVTFTQLLKGIEQPRDIALMSVGWLAREGHVVVKGEGQEYRVWLRKG
ncbi:MAG: winged helix-turn-helix domain-containing protein [Candidatus Omnitrophica bacterium]|nr:winged helix-turn-helix domain-containing protein [Candidatus Omnitrophota bacterium]